MSVEKLQLLHEDYIRLTERFKALWTFQQFLRGIVKTFSAPGPEHAADFNGLYEEVKAVGANLSGLPPETASRRMQQLFARLDAVSGELRESDRRISPSLVRRFFDRIRPQDEKIAFYLLRYYFSQPDVDEDVIDKVDFLATVAATGRPEPDATASRPRSAIRKLFESVTTASVWPRIEAGMTPAIVRAFDELASDVTQAREFEQLLTERLLNNARTMKRRVATGLADPDILTAVAWCNLTTRSVFHRLYEKEERRLDEATGRIADLERELTRGGEDAAAPQEFRRFRESRVRFDRLATERNLRAQHIMELKLAIGEVLEKFDISGLEAEDIDEALELVEEVDASSEDEGFWKPCLNRVLGPVERAERGGAGPAGGLAPLRLETWELAAARRTLEHGEAPTDADRTYLRAAALRVRAEEEAEALRRLPEGAPAVEALRAARGTLARCEPIEAALEQMSSESHRFEEAHSWDRTRHRLRQASAALWLEVDRLS
ncbi:MAG: hypothetical protein ACRD3M_15825 [Thermoanaerobaculia bacterium]